VMQSQFAAFSAVQVAHTLARPFTFLVLSSASCCRLTQYTTEVGDSWPDMVSDKPEIYWYRTSLGCAWVLALLVWTVEARPRCWCALCSLANENPV
jgi:hypothetical protein